MLSTIWLIQFNFIFGQLSLLKRTISLALHEKEVLVVFIIQRRYVEPLLWGLVFGYIVFGFIRFQMRF